AGWEVDGVAKKVGDKITVNENTTVTAKYKPLMVDVSFDKGEGSGNKDKVSVAKGSEYTLPDSEGFTPPENQEFAGWEVDGVAKKVGDKITVNENTTVTAKYKPTTPGTPGKDPDPGTGTDPGTKPGTDPGTKPGTDPGTKPGTDPGTDPGTKPGTDPGTKPGTKPGTDPGTKPGTDPGTDPGTKPGTDPGTNPGTKPGTDPGTDPGTQPGGTTPGTPEDKPNTPESPEETNPKTPSSDESKLPEEKNPDNPGTKDSDKTKANDPSETKAEDPKLKEESSKIDGKKNKANNSIKIPKTNRPNVKTGVESVAGIVCTLVGSTGALYISRKKEEN
ncbi:hypothetical protein NH286_07660, partial [Anaerococcus sp. NML200574]|nr:hypothetical protein [Anaerococcus sp. NML200574]